MAEAVEECFGGQVAGDFSSGHTAHAIADDEDAVLGKCCAGVLIGVADAAAMREHGEGVS